MAEGRSVVLGWFVIAEKFRLLLHREAQCGGGQICCFGLVCHSREIQTIAPQRGASVAEGRSVVLGRLVIAEKFRLLLHREAPVWWRADLLFWVGLS